MLRTGNPDVVFVLVPTGGQTVVALTAERQKCYLITEIPYALTLNYSDTTAETYQQNGVKWGIAENVWLWPNGQRKQKILPTEVFRQITHARLWYKSGNYHGFNTIRMILNSNPKQGLGFAKELDIRPYDSYGDRRLLPPEGGEITGKLKVLKGIFPQTNWCFTLINRHIR